MAFKNTTVYPMILGGMDAGLVDPKVSEKPSLVMNGVYRRLGAVDKRFGTELVRSTGALKVMFTLDGVVHGLGETLTAETEAGPSTIAEGIRLTDIGLQNYIGDRTTSIVWTDAGRAGDILCFVYVLKNGASDYDTIVETFSISKRLRIDTSTIHSGKSTPRTARVINRLGQNVVCYVERLSRPKYIEVSTSGAIGPAIEVSTVYYSDTNSDIFDAAVIDDEIHFAYKTSSARVVVCDESGNYDTAPWTSYAIALTEWDGYGCLTYATYADAYAAKVTPGVTVDSPTQIASYTNTINALGVCAVDSDTAHIWWSTVKSTWPYGRSTSRISFDKDTTVGSETLITNHGQMLTQPFAPTNDVESYCFLAVGTDDESGTDQVAVLTDDYGTYQGATLSQEANTPEIDANSLGTPTVQYDGGFWYAGLIREQGTGSESVVALAELDVDPTAPRIETNASVAYIPNSLPHQYGRNYYGYSGFLHAPIITVENSGTPGDPTSGVTYGYKACYTRIDELGNVWYGPMSNTATIESNGDTIDIEVSTTDSQGYGDFDIAVFRTYKQTEAFYLIETVANDDSAYSVSVEDDTADSLIREKVQAYTNSRLSMAPWPGYRVHGFAKNRYWIVPRHEENTTLWYSNQLLIGEAPQFTGLYVDIPEHGGRITAIVDYLDKVIIFKETAIYAIEGEGLDAGGNGNDFRRAYLIDASVGCVNPRSVCRFGLMVGFESANGIYQLKSSLSAEPLGLEVKAFSDDCEIGNVLVLPDTNELVFMSDGYALDYNYLYGLWSVWDSHNSDSSTFDGSSIWFSAGSDLLKTTIDYHDEGQWYPLEITTPWVSRSKIGGYQRFKSIQVIGQKLSDGYLDIGVGYNYAPTFVNEPHYFDASVLESFDWSAHIGEDLGGNTEALLVKAWPGNTRSSAIRVKVSDREPDTIDGYQGLSLSALAFEFTGVRGANRNAKPGKFGG